MFLPAFMSCTAQQKDIARAKGIAASPMEDEEE
jgi:hypothetical protein